MIDSILRTTFLELNSPADFRPVYCDDPSLMIIQARVPLVSFYRFLYSAVGEPWLWIDRNSWTNERLHSWLALPTTSLYVLYTDGTPAGYIELDAQPKATELAYFGLIPQFFGRGYGGHLLSYGIQQAWDAGAQRIWVHTCNLDAEAAVPNYQKRGFSIYKVEESPMPHRFTEAAEALRR